MEGGRGRVTWESVILKRQSEECHTQEQPLTEHSGHAEAQSCPSSLPSHQYLLVRAHPLPPTPVTGLQGLAHAAPAELSSLICSASFNTQVKCHHSLHLFKTTDTCLSPSPDWAKLKDRSHVYSFYTAGVPSSTCVRGGGGHVRDCGR